MIALGLCVLATVVQPTPWGPIEVSGDAQATQVILAVTQDTNLTRHLAHDHTMVVSLPAVGLLQRLAKSQKGCLYPAAALEELSHSVQKQLDLPRYVLPMLVGQGEGAALVQAAFAQAPPNTFLGAVAVDGCPLLRAPRPLCAGRALHVDTDGHIKPFAPGAEPFAVIRYGQDCSPAHRSPPAVCTETLPPPLPGWTQTSPASPACAAPSASLPQPPAASCQASNPPALPASASQSETTAPCRDFNTLLHVLDQTLVGFAPAPVPPPPSDLKDLPLVEVPATQSGHSLAVIVSGDGGWASLDRDLAAALAQRGIATVGLNALQYFWQARTADEMGADLQRIVAHYRRAWDKGSVILVGFSLGADVLPFMVNRLDNATKSVVTAVALLAPSPQVEFEFHVTDWLASRAKGFAVAPEIERMTLPNVLCVYPLNDHETPCLKTHIGKRMPLAGGHHLGGDGAKLAEAIMSFSESKQ